MGIANEGAAPTKPRPVSARSTAKIRVDLIAVVVALALGATVVGLWARFVYDRTPGPHCISVTAGRGGVAFTPERYPGDSPPEWDASPVGQWTRDSAGQWSTKHQGDRWVYCGSVSRVVHLNWSVPNASTQPRLEIDQRRVGVVLDDEGAGRTTIGFALRVPLANWLLLALGLAVAVGLHSAITRRCRAAAGDRGPPQIVGIVVASAALALLIVLTLPIAPARLLMYRMNIQVTSHGSTTPLGVRLIRADGRNDDARALAGGAIGWQAQGEWTEAEPGASPLLWEGAASPDDEIVVGRSDAPPVLIRVNGHLTRVDPSARSGVDSDNPRRPPGQYLSLSDLAGSEGMTRELAILASRLLDAALLATLGLLAVVLVSTRASRSLAPESGTSERHRLSDRWRSFLGLVTGWTALLLIFWPGFLSSDSQDQWSQFFTPGARLSDAHPYLISMAYGSLRHVVDSPAVPIMGYLVVMAVVASGLIDRLRGAGTPRWIGTLSVVALCCLPPVALITIALWKDVPYGIAVVAAVSLLAGAEMSNGASVGTRRAAIAIAVTIAGVALTRHNGVPVAAVLALQLLFRFRRQWRFVAPGVAAGVMIIVVVNGPLMSAAHVNSDTLDGLYWAQRVAAHLSAGTTLTVDERHELDAIRPTTERWGYSCHSIYPTIEGPNAIPTQKARDEAGPLRSLVLALDVRNPMVEVRHSLCTSELAWRWSDNRNLAYLLPWTRSSDIVNYDNSWTVGGPQEDPASPRLVSTVNRVVTEDLPVGFSRPAPLFWLLIVSCLACAVRTKRWVPVLVAMPLLVHTAVLAPIVPDQDIRYMYPVMVAAVLIGPAFLWSAMTRRSLFPPSSDRGLLQALRERLRTRATAHGVEPSRAHRRKPG